jgi:aldehyde:ferredoxin oxidoreductase
VREGLRRKDDTIPDYAFSTDPPEYLPVLKKRGYRRLDRNLINKQIDLWYLLKGWDRDGIPTKKTLEKLGLEFVYLELKQRGITS